MNNKGQWLLLSGLILSIGLVVLVILLNQAMSAGYKVSAAETDFSSREINEIFEETVRTSWLVWNATENDKTQFDTNMSYFSENISNIYATRGVLVEVNATMNTSYNIMDLNMRYRDGEVNFMLGNFTPEGARKIQIYG